MKLTNTHNMKRKAGMTLLELTVVILVLLSLISILFVGARAWKKGSDRAANIMNIRNCQQAMRGHQNMKGLEIAAPFLQADLEDYIKYPTAIGTTVVTYTNTAAITADSASPAIDTTHLWLIPSVLGQPGAEYGHNSVADVTGW
jgi:type II secretory pathway pseudopilin PulG